LVKNNEKAGKTVFSIEFTSLPPIELNIIAGEAVHQLRSALDHLIWQLVDKKTRGPDTAFPFYKTRALYKADPRGKIKGIASKAKHILDTIKLSSQPFEGHIQSCACI